MLSYFSAVTVTVIPNRQLKMPWRTDFFQGLIFSLSVQEHPQQLGAKLQEVLFIWYLIRA
jgi:hypothetical protein